MWTHRLPRSLDNSGQKACGTLLPSLSPYVDRKSCAVKAVGSQSRPPLACLLLAFTAARVHQLEKTIARGLPSPGTRVSHHVSTPDKTCTSDQVQISLFLNAGHPR